MGEAALAVAIAAIAITLFGVILQWLAYRATIDQAQKAAQNVADMRTEMHGLVGELRGLTERLVEAQERQFNRMLDAFVTRPGVAAEVAEQTGESADRLQKMSEAMDALKEEVRQAAGSAEVEGKLDELAGRLEAVSRSARRAARLAEGAARRGAPLGELGSISLIFYPREIEQGGEVRIAPSGWRPKGDMEYLRCAVMSPDGQVWDGEFHQDLKWGSPPSLAFPSAFPGASTELPGEYQVNVARSEGGKWMIEALGSFYVSSSVRGPHD